MDKDKIFSWKRNQNVYKVMRTVDEELYIDGDTDRIGIKCGKCDTGFWVSRQCVERRLNCECHNCKTELRYSSEVWHEAVIRYDPSTGQYCENA